MNQRPSPISGELIEQFRIAMTRVDPDDWDAFKRRVDTARKLAARAFQEKDRAAWEVVQVIQWRLQQKANLRPTEMGDVAVLDTMYRLEESTLPKVDLPHGLTPKQFAERLERDLLQYGAANRQDYRDAIMSISRDGWRWGGYQMLAQARDFCRMIALSSLPLPHELGRFMWYNLFDEGGRGELDRMHHTLLKQFLDSVGVTWNDEEEMLKWVAPDVIAMVNAQNRILWHPESAYSLGSMFIYEKLVPSDMAVVQTRLVELGFTEEQLVWFAEHIVVDVHHAEEWLGVVEAHVVEHDDQRLAYQAAIERARWGEREMDEWVNSYAVWNKTGVPPHLPFRELRAATGL